MRLKLFKSLSLVTILSAGLLVTSCSHLTPYYQHPFHHPRIHYPEEGDLSFRLLLIGDVGKSEESDPGLSQLTKWASRHPQKTMIVFLGDNVYPSGMPPEAHQDRKEAERRLLAQINVVRDSGARGLFIPGNHDWRNGLSGLMHQQNFIAIQLNREDSFIPQAGCPGPQKIDIENIRIIVIDTTFWLDKSLEPLKDCPCKNLKSALAEVKALLGSAGNRHVVFLTHNPLDTHGEHGGFFDWEDHLFPLTNLVDWLWIPLPVVGSFYPLLRRNVIRNKFDLSSDSYKNMIWVLKMAFKEKKPLIYAAGHDHSLQVLDGGEAVGYILVSGAGSKSHLSPVSHGENTIFAHQHVGFMAVDFLRDGEVWLYVVEPSKNEVVFLKKLETN